MLFPSKVKYRKQHRRRGSNLIVASDKIAVNFGEFGLRAVEPGLITARQIEAARRAITHFLQKKGKLWIRLFPDQSVTTKGNEVPMGGGKGAVDHYVAPTRPGTIMFEVDGIAESEAREAFRLAGSKLPVKTKFVKRT